MRGRGYWQADIVQAHTAMTPLILRSINSHAASSKSPATCPAFAATLGDGVRAGIEAVTAGDDDRALMGGVRPVVFLSRYRGGCAKSATSSQSMSARNEPAHGCVRKRGLGVPDHPSLHVCVDLHPKSCHATVAVVVTVLPRQVQHVPCCLGDLEAQSCVHLVWQGRRPGKVAQKRAEYPRIV